MPRVLALPQALPVQLGHAPCPPRRALAHRRPFLRCPEWVAGRLLVHPGKGLVGRQSPWPIWHKPPPLPSPWGGCSGAATPAPKCGNSTLEGHADFSCEFPWHPLPPPALSLSLTHSYTHAHTLALGSQSQQAQEKERRGQGAGAVGIPLLCWEHPGDNWEPGSWQHQHSLPPADTVPVPQPD